MNGNPKPKGYWTAVILAWAMVVFLVGVTLESASERDWKGAIFFAFSTVIFLLFMFKPKWWQKFVSD